MERGVYVLEFGGLTELTAVDQSGRVVRRTTVRTDLYAPRDLEYLERWLDGVSPRVSGLRLV